MLVTIAEPQLSLLSNIGISIRGLVRRSRDKKRNNKVSSRDLESLGSADHDALRIYCWGLIGQRGYMGMMIAAG
jgi:hypothetical protein